MTSVGVVAGLHPIVWLRAHPRAADLLLATATTAVSVTFHLLALDSTEQFRDPSWWTVLLVIASVFPITWRRSFPIRSGVFVSAAQILSALLDIDGTGFLGVLIAIYSLGAHSVGHRRARAMAVIGIGILLLFIAGITVGEVDVGDFLSSTIFLVTAFVLGDNLRRRRERAESVAERAERAEREHALIAQQQLNDERTRIARELHDVVAHSVSVMVIQAAAARRNLTGDPEVAGTALANIEDTGRQAMHELRGILGVLRSPSEADSSLTPQPTLSDIDALVRASDDLPIELHADASESALDGLTPAVTLIGYRVVQEAITNVRRHAGPVTVVTIDIERSADSLTITVADDGRGGSADQSGPGYGVIGMHERVAAVGGSVDVGPRQGGGWRVRTVLPIDGSADGNSALAAAATSKDRRRSDGAMT